MALTQSVVDGKLVDNSASATSSSSKTSDSNNSFDKDMFLKLLVAEMQYQDPLEPTSNTEYVSELASFSQIEAVQAVQGQVSNMEASSLVGKYVILLTNDTDGGEGQYVSGKVDFVQNDDGDMFLSVNDKLYSIDDLYSVADEEYYEAAITAQTITDLVAKLPSETNLTLQDEQKLKDIREIVDSMDTYQQQFLVKEDVEKLIVLEKRMAELKKASEGAEASQETTDSQGTDETNPSDETTETVASGSVDTE